MINTGSNFVISTTTWFHPVATIPTWFTQTLSQLAKRQLGTAAAAPKLVYPAYVTDAPVTEVSATSNGVRVASEVSLSFCH